MCLKILEASDIGETRCGPTGRLLALTHRAWLQKAAVSCTGFRALEKAGPC